MDPSSRRFLWDVILDHLKDRASILTTHAMEEADALCSRIAILVNGHLQCIGTPSQLKQQYGDGYHLEMSVPLARVEEARKMVSEMFPGSILEEEWGSHLRYRVMQTDAPLSENFKNLEECKERLEVEEYAFSQTTLEQVFISFARKQKV